MVILMVILMTNFKASNLGHKLNGVSIKVNKKSIYLNIQLKWLKSILYANPGGFV